LVIKLAWRAPVCKAAYASSKASIYLYMVINLALRMPVLRATTMSSKKKMSTTTSIASVGIEEHSGSSLPRVVAEDRGIRRGGGVGGGRGGVRGEGVRRRDDRQESKELDEAKAGGLLAGLNLNSLRASK
jgi:hypothetical protein